MLNTSSFNKLAGVFVKVVLPSAKNGFMVNSTSTGYEVSKKLPGSSLGL